MQLSFAPIGQSATITSIHANESVCKHLNNLGFTVGSTVKPLLESGGSLILEIRGGRLALDRTLALKIQVEGGNHAKIS